MFAIKKSVVWVAVLVAGAAVGTCTEAKDSSRDDSGADSGDTSGGDSDADVSSDSNTDTDSNAELCAATIFERDFDDSNPSNDWSFFLGPIFEVPNTPSVPVYPWFPDGHIAVLAACDASPNWIMFWSEFENYRSIGTSQFPEDQATLQPSGPVFGGRGNWDGYDNGGSWLMSVHRTSGNELIGFYHAEDHWYPHTDNDIAWKSIGVTHSFDNGASWQTGAQIITSDQPKPLAPSWGGSGDNSVIWDWKNDRWVCFFQESSLRLAISESHQGEPGSWYKWNNGVFTEPGLGGMSDALPGLPHGANPSVHWNTYLKKWVMVYAGWNPANILITASDDLVHWEQVRTVASSSVGGRAWYVTIIGEDDNLAGQSAQLYYADIEPDFSSRQFVGRTITFERND